MLLFLQRGRGLPKISAGPSWRRKAAAAIAVLLCYKDRDPVPPAAEGTFHAVCGMNLAEQGFRASLDVKACSRCATVV